ncbi:undecaprenyldiphospho-muramoylpentapeptide beta-N-acetylglucosaminyltransferase [Brevibacillus humidisoli]|uniref:undecaprenyldiphospho-muramoylpentapeptide beta-N-acetylglucosaminyltransferase n=1 Tax=Brevibacillus humidisoli TaxID=2895522 RepID=UPI001E42EFE5|nr:undecaprenyldiphospho-muramoylpentapeptide beta-N-acetylglucosaminyltransferase [Brevibacillus humidisoli]UFJ41924.1 undecaprenyldiphospho-muramoylpentapeptide beta-N-acetylglucosaminyltransferase [Brevibacillus humidisoli]
MRVVLTGGGTGGHIYPALAIAGELKRLEPEASFLYVGTNKGLESSLVPRQGIPFEAIDISGFKRKLTFENARTIWRFLRAVSRSKQILREYRPDLVVGTGGYVCGPVVYAASRLGIPTLIHEQNVVPGLTNRFLARFASKIAVSFEESLAYFPKQKTVFTGNPRATEVIHGDAEAARRSLSIPTDKKIILLVGGSRGARAINEATLVLSEAMSEFTDCHFVYVTGEVHYETIKATLHERSGSPDNLTLLPYVHNMPDLLAATYVSVNRAGASTLAELTALGIPSILIPSPYVTNNHQEKNARGLERAGAAVVLLEKELSGATLKQALASILGDQDKWSQMHDQSRKIGKPDAARQIVHLLRGTH